MLINYQYFRILFIIRWEFMTEEKDIMFRLFYRNQNGEKVDVVPVEKVECQLMMEEGEITCFSHRTCAL